ncbi:hypothetical protein GALL_524340 [mine drainage metagenome]|uniref:Uncharacterized protein n=1 Tax=mine drainage metagenome TaxID=410659 RepID=A0A1J5P4F4_9ZZZZ
MAFRGKVHHRIGLMHLKHPVQRGAVANIGFLKRISRRVRYRGHVLQTGRIGQRVKVDHRMPVADRLPHHRRSDKSSPARH